MEYEFRPKLTSLLTIIFLVLFLSMFAVGQGIVTGSVSGTVLDPQGAVVPGAKVTAVHIGTNRNFTTATTSAGIFSLRGLPPGAYDVRIQAPNFRTFESKGVQVAVGVDSSLGAVKMELGATAETLTVEGAAPLVETTSDQLTQTFSSQKTESLPIGNNFDSLTLFVPGVAS